MRSRLALAALVAGALVAAWLMRWGCDDAFITYVYSRNLVYGDGLTWFGDHVEGYTNFGWVLWNAGGFAVGLDPLVWSWVGSLAALALTLVTVFRIARLRTGSETAAFLAVGLVATNYTFIAYGTSGLETMAQTALLAVVWLEVETIRRTDAPTVRPLAWVSTHAAVALWLRLDSAVYLAVLGSVTAVHLVRVRASRVVWLAAIAPALVLVGGWLAWKVAYYGEILPNTFHAKVAVSGMTIAFAAKYTWWFLHEYALYVPLGIATVLSAMRKRFTARLPLALVVAGISYVLFTGGDFMEFRFFVPMLPALFVLVAESVASEGPPGAPWVRAALVVAFSLAMSIKHAVTYKGAPDFSVDSVDGLRKFYGVVWDNDWSRLGTPIGDALHDTSAIIACNGAGAIPYYADIPVVDQLGLNDRWVARHGVQPKGYPRPGHQRFATQEYLAERKVNFVVGTPNLVETGALTNIGMTRGIGNWMNQLLGPVFVNADSLTVVAVPLGNRLSLLMWYMRETQEITTRIRAAGWEIQTFYKR